jgi:hypothetical protein
MASVIENYSKFEVNVMVRCLQAEGVSQSENHHILVFMARTFSAERQCLCGAANLNMSEQH